ncbi:MAG: 2-C-methyl-D-erythritol 4-phosphate cytidylyltransferase [Pontiellaceae bacterium]|nr:2-C-methyl-D-erythritol 4-phosphate cytidylyltransferase [Pontiellaceae bacterium]MBN2785534.1 2-C-methyl-D-erythritol 4-phosphate cytidylyltransferase [Pontiellaceae bacterium]
MNTLAVVVACGKEEEIAAGTESAFLPLGQTPVLAVTLHALQASSAIDSVIVAVSKARTETALHLVKRYGCTKVRGIVMGGSSRLSTLRTVMSKIDSSPSVIVIHEVSRPFVTPLTLNETVKAAKRYGCAIAAHRCPDAVKIAPKGMKVADTMERNSAWGAQTPQAFKADVLKSILNSKAKCTQVLDDESELVPKSSEVHMVEAGPFNLKIRTSEDLQLASALLNARLAG